MGISAWKFTRGIFQQHKNDHYQSANNRSTDCQPKYQDSVQISNAVSLIWEKLEIFFIGRLRVTVPVLVHPQNRGERQKI